MNITKSLNSTQSSVLVEQPPKYCYCEPSFEQEPSECNPTGCKTVSALILAGFIVTLGFCIYRFNQLRTRKDNRWPLFTLSLITITCLARVIRAILTLVEETNFYVMGLLFLLPMGVLICSFFNTLFVWVKIIHHFNFSKVVSKVFPFLGKIFIASQVILMLLLIVICLASLRYNASNIVLLVFLAMGGFFAVIFTKMIWGEYKDLSSKESGVFNPANDQKIKKIFKLSITSIFVTGGVIGLTIWGFLLGGVLTIPHAIAFNFVGRSIEIAWITVMLIILAPQLQTWSQNSTKESNNFDSGDSDSSSSTSKGDIESSNDSKNNNHNNNNNNNNNNNGVSPNSNVNGNGSNDSQPTTTTAVVTTSPINSNIHQNQLELDPISDGAN